MKHVRKPVSEGRLCLLYSYRLWLSIQLFVTMQSCWKAALLGVFSLQIPIWVIIRSVCGGWQMTRDKRWILEEGSSCWGLRLKVLRLAFENRSIEGPLNSIFVNFLARHCSSIGCILSMQRPHWVKAAVHVLELLDLHPRSYKWWMSDM